MADHSKRDDDSDDEATDTAGFWASVCEALYYVIAMLTFSS